MKNKYGLLVLSIVLASCAVNETKSNATTETLEVPISHSYTEVSEYYLTWDSIFDPQENNYYVYIYSSTCSHCEELKNYIIDKALKSGEIYFVKGTSKDQLTSDTKKLIGAEKPGDIWILGYPSLLKIFSHKITKNLAGTNQIKGELK